MTTRKLKNIERKRMRLLEELLGIKAMVKGVFGVTYRRCGKSNCWCAEGKGHEYSRITWSEGGHSRTKSVAVRDQNWVRKMTLNYKRFRELRQELRELEIEFKQLLDQKEVAIIEKTKKL